MCRLVLISFILVVALCTIPLGSNVDWAWAPLGAAIGALLVGLAARRWFDPVRRPEVLVPVGALSLPAALFFLAVSWGLVQLLGIIPHHWATPIAASPTLPLAEPSHSITFDRERQWTALLRLLTYAGVFGLAAALARHRVDDARRILATLVLVAALSTCYAMAAEVINGQASALGISVWVPQERVFSGTFVNPNNYATYAAVLALTALVLAFRLPGRNTEREATRERWRRRISAVSGLRGVWFALALILCAGVLLSGSRAGMGSLILGLVAMAMFYTRGMARVLFAVLIPLVVTALMVFAPAGERLTEKSVSLVHEGAGSRELLAKMTLDAIEARPWVGWGMNSFEDLYNVLQPPSLTEFFDKSHNTYLELAFDLGIPVASALVLAVGLVAGRCAVGCVVRKRDRELPMLGLLTTMMVAFHALFDFSLQIPAMTCTYMAILGVAWANSWSRHTRVAE